MATSLIFVDVEWNEMANKVQIYSDNDGIYDCTLNKTDDNNETITYRMELLKVNEQTEYYLLIDKSGSSKLLESFHSNIEAVKSKFCSIFHDLTGNYWHLRESFSKIRGHYSYI
ncbi:unnamed protein product, partial [Didymodactylos carnosus]